MSTVALLVVVAPVVVAVVRAALDGWLPLGDNAYFTARSLDVLGPAHPLVGAWSSGSASLDVPVNNLGPLQLDLLAPFTRIDPEFGTALGVAAVNGASLVGAGLVVRRLLTPSAVLVALAAAALLAWMMGSALLLEPRQHHALMLPWFCFLVLCWGIAAGDRWLLPWAVFVGSLIVQTHLSYVLLVPLLALWAGVGLILATRRASRDRPDPPGQADDPAPPVRGAWWRALRAPVAVAGVVAALVWIQVVVDQVAGTGNLRRLADAGSSSQEANPGLAPAVRIVGSVLAAPWRWERQGFRRFLPASDGTTWLAAVGLGVVLAGLGVLAWQAQRRGRPVAAAAPATAAVAVVSAVVAVARTPASALGPIPGNYRWLWPLAAFVLFAAVVGAVAALPPSFRPAVVERRLMAGAAAVLVVVSVANLPTAYQIDIARTDARRRPLAVELLAQLDRVDLPDPVLYDRSRSTFGEPYSYLVMVALHERGIEFTVDDDSRDALRFGESRRDRGRASHRLVILTGPAARTAPEEERVAFVTSVTDADRREREARLAEVLAAVRDGVLVPDRDARRAMAAGDYSALAALEAGEEPSTWDLRGDVNRLHREGRLDGPPEVLEAVRRLDELEQQELFETVALVLQPQP